MRKSLRTIKRRLRIVWLRLIRQYTCKHAKLYSIYPNCGMNKWKICCKCDKVVVKL